jgi:predicted RNA-binding Zn-ribbon protein involved in translation (DUF1610 family)
MGANPLDPIRHQINAGDRQGARIALARLLEAEPDNADAWALLAILLADPAEQAQCYREILRINPNDRQARLWLESLTGAQPLAQEPGGRSCPRCGAIVKASVMPGSPGGRFVCPYCGFPIEPDNAFGRKVPVPEEEELDQPLETVSLPNDAESQPPNREPEIPRRPAERKGLLDGLLGRSRGTALEPEAEDLLTGQERLLSAAGALSPDLILRLAGGPLAPEERRECPQCGAIVSRREARCSWCSAPLQDAEGQ